VNNKGGHVKKALAVTAFLGTSLFLAYAVAQQATPKGEPPQKFQLATPGVPIAGIPHDEALKISERHVKELYNLPGVISVSFTAEGLVVETFKPEVLPPSVEGLPVIPIPPIAKNAAAGLLEPLPTSPPEPVPPEAPPPVVEAPEPPEEPCPPGTHREAPHSRCRYDNPPPEVIEDSGSSDLLPPPPGVIVLRPEKVREQAESCPENFQEVKVYNNWRFCIDPLRPEPIPPLMAPPIAGIPFEEAQAIHLRHIDELGKLPGVDAVGLGAHGINVYTTNPAVVPKAVEGLPIIVKPPIGPVFLRAHTDYSEVRPLHGAVGVASPGFGKESLTGIVLSDGKPWLVFPAHFLSTCKDTAPCPTNLPLNLCSHYSSSGPRINQPFSSSTFVGYAQRWTPLDPNVFDVAGNLLHASIPSLDLGAAFMDSDTTEGNGSLSADRSVEISSVTPRTTPFSGAVVPPIVSSTNRVYMRTASVGKPDGSHEYEMRVTHINVDKTDVRHGCLGTDNQNRQQSITLTGQTFYTVTSPYGIVDGDSGAPVFDANQNLIGMINGSGPAGYNHLAFGTSATHMKDALKFDAWYGTQTVNDNSIGLFRPSNALWSRDNGNGKFDGCGAEANEANATTKDYCYGVFGAPGKNDIPVTGDWDGNGSITPGVYHTDPTACPNPPPPTTPSQCFRISNSVSPPLATSFTLLTAGTAIGYKPVVGKWVGPPQYLNRTKLGVFSSQSGIWYLDNGDGIVQGCSVDYCPNTSSWTQLNDLPIAGDWDRNGTVTIGVFRPSNGNFYLSNTQLGVGVQPSLDPFYTTAAAAPNSGYIPVVGNWTGTPGDKLGLFSPAIVRWYRDNGNRIWPSCTEDQCTTALNYEGFAGDQPAVFGKTTVRGN
jgi:hypothetical protein